MVSLRSVALAALALFTACAPPAPAAARRPATVAPQPSATSYRDPNLPVAQRVSDLMSRMTLAEKVAQLGSVNWEHTHLDDAATHRFSPDAARRFIPSGIGEVTRPGDRHDGRGASEFANAIQKYLVEETRLGIPALLHEEALHGFVAPGGTSFRRPSRSPRRSIRRWSKTCSRSPLGRPGRAASSTWRMSSRESCAIPSR